MPGKAPGGGLGVFRGFTKKGYNPANAVDIFAVLSEGVFDTCNAAGGKFGILRIQGLIEENRLKSAQELPARCADNLRFFPKQQSRR